MYVCGYVHTHIITYIRTRVSSQALHITEMEIIWVIALFIWQRVMAAAAGGGWRGGRHNDGKFNVLFAKLKRNAQSLDP